MRLTAIGEARENAYDDSGCDRSLGVCYKCVGCVCVALNTDGVYLFSCHAVIMAFLIYCLAGKKILRHRVFKVFVPRDIVTQSVILDVIVTLSHSL